MFKKKIIYSDIPRPYDEEEARLVRRVGLIILTLIVLAGIILAIGWK
jgi:hypothetical protein